MTPSRRHLILNLIVLACFLASAAVALQTLEGTTSMAGLITLIAGAFGAGASLTAALQAYRAQRATEQRRPESAGRYHLLFYTTVENYVARRAPFRDAHLAMAQAAHARGELVMAGAFAEPADGAVLVFRGDSPCVAEAFAENDPYVQNGLIAEWRVRPWTVVIGG